MCRRCVGSVCTGCDPQATRYTDCVKPPPTCSLAGAVYEIEAPGRDGKLKPFEKPWACTAMMFVGMTFCLPLAYWVDARKAAKKEAGEDASSPLLGDDDDGPVRRPGLP